MSRLDMAISLYGILISHVDKINNSKSKAFFRHQEQQLHVVYVLGLGLRVP